MEFILGQHAKNEVLWLRSEERWKRADERMDKFPGRPLTVLSDEPGAVVLDDRRELVSGRLYFSPI